MQIVTDNGFFIKRNDLLNKITIVLPNRKLLCKCFSKLSSDMCFSSPEDNVLQVSFCDDPLSVVQRPSVRLSVNNFT